MGRVQLILVCALPVLAILFVQMEQQKRNEPSDISGCYRAPDVAFDLKTGFLIVAGKSIAGVQLQYFKQQPYLTTEPGIDILPGPPRIIAKANGYPEHYPMVTKAGHIEVTVVSTDNQQHIFNRVPCT